MFRSSNRYAIKNSVRYGVNCLIKKFRRATKRRLKVSPGISFVMSLRGFACLLGFIFYRKIKGQQSFLVQGRAYRYFDSKLTWYNERSVEIPFILEEVKTTEHKNILEIGNVLSHHIYVNHDIIDRYEIAKGVTNSDVADFTSNKKYELIVSISTLEHVGWDEKIRDEMKIIRALENLKNHGKRIVVTLPLGYNPNLDMLLRKGTITFSERICLLRVSRGNSWRQVLWDDIQNAKYNEPLPFANGLLIGIIY